MRISARTFRVGGAFPTFLAALSIESRLPLVIDLMPWKRLFDWSTKDVLRLNEVVVALTVVVCAVGLLFGKAEYRVIFLMLITFAVLSLARTRWISQRRRKDVIQIRVRYRQKK